MRAPNNNNVVSFGDVMVTTEDLGALQDGQWLTDTIIEFFFEWLERSVLASLSSRQYARVVVLVRPAIAHLIVCVNGTYTTLYIYICSLFYNLNTRCRRRCRQGCSRVAESSQCRLGLYSCEWQRGRCRRRLALVFVGILEISKHVLLLRWVDLTNSPGLPPLPILHQLYRHIIVLMCSYWI